MPTKKLILLMLVVSLSLFVASFFGITWTFIILCNAVVLFATFLDLFLSPNKRQLSFERVLPQEMERDITYEVELKIENHSDKAIKFRFKDDLPQSFKRPFPYYGTAEKDRATIVTYETAAPVRGEYTINQLYFRYRSTLGLWEKQKTVNMEKTVKVIPDLTETKEYLENAQKFLLHEGVKIKKQNSSVGEFAKVRNYVVGDDPRKINWRQTAKLQEVMTNEYEPEHGKHITLLIDCGRMMGVELKRGNRLDKSLEAAIAVAAAALKKGDYVAVLAFSKGTKVYVPPGKGMEHLQTILKAVYNLKADAAESNYGVVLNYLQTVQKKRSLLLLFSDVKTFLHEESALAYLRRLRQRHVFLMIGIEDEELRKQIKKQPSDMQSTMVKSIAQQQMVFKKREKNRWEKQGLQMIEAKEENLAVTAISNYIDIINRGLL
ncbi:DUF58 domain-containing protein [Bacillus cellulosilyticus]|uniref:VWFA domain-containing protein n=1 Tax=Evansella cellulosilytica (strain ATCC 21833 / DSM 2522 / FERM P-1141 / JCM 9156 / N-4) TaxID=649639 RepID=E6TZ25_EVAC2|nr:protein of unknown function DUF58 [Evansella cellulosilytica DSM 2522]